MPCLHKRGKTQWNNRIMIYLHGDTLSDRFFVGWNFSGYFMFYFTGIIGIFILVVKKLTSRMLCGLGNTRHRYYHWRFCSGNILLSVSGGPLEYPKYNVYLPKTNMNNKRHWPWAGLYLHINIVLYCLCFCYFHVMAEHKYIGPETINSLAAAHNIMRIPGKR